MCFLKHWDLTQPEQEKIKGGGRNDLEHILTSDKKVLKTERHYSVTNVIVILRIFHGKQKINLDSLNLLSI